MKFQSFVFTVIITALLVAGGMYYWQQSNIESLNKRIADTKEDGISLWLESKPMSFGALLSLPHDSFLCTGDPIERIGGISGEYSMYPEADDYRLFSGDGQDIAALFTADACGRERLMELFGTRTFFDVALSVYKSDAGLIKYLKENGFKCEDKNALDIDCEVWHNGGTIPLDVMTGLRKWSNMIFGSDCRSCG